MKYFDIFNIRFIKILLAMATTLFLLSCASTDTSESDDNPLFQKMIIELSDVEFKKQGISPEGRPYMANICKGFILSEDIVRDFFVHSERVSEAEASERYKTLPCYSVGTAQIKSEKYNWIIRAGGIGEFYNKDNKFYKVCGKECCKKNQVLC
ncbi:MAG: hypothetical protein OEZ33_00450 [Gammaproteobacteria bacterium]|nr:hypothetical protein [Gammaproteobacteria bacterium]